MKGEKFMSLKTEKLKLGKVILSERIDELMSVDYFALMQIHDCLALHESCIWGELSEEDKQINDMALINDARIISSYNTDYGKISIITEDDRTITTICFTDEN
ncbi:hypothetical protein DW220_00005 [Eubacterium sp. AM18-26]|uniref:Type I restriction endonuclease subunit M n=2 Tax=Amedibacterium intestinale TaxID=2583452 RepID=A0A6N4TJL5_9FIRM|nr:hypothetical protein DW220_00005 [Eubacterium sp. AM18-26]RHO28890.1 hypothetical protein DW212_00745 [Eubacterium sp. AM18-10LB-B]BBK22664.1 hypothetical protein Aargi30884_15670 [Amedibacterium intestinale]